MYFILNRVKCPNTTKISNDTALLNFLFKHERSILKSPRVFAYSNKKALFGLKMIYDLK